MIENVKLNIKEGSIKVGDDKEIPISTEETVIKKVDERHMERMYDVFSKLVNMIGLEDLRKLKKSDESCARLIGWVIDARELHNKRCDELEKAEKDEDEEDEDEETPAGDDETIRRCFNERVGILEENRK